MQTRVLLRSLSGLFLLASAFSQNNPDNTIRITVNLVQVDAVVMDAKGKQVTDLEAKDFEILQDGKPQDIGHKVGDLQHRLGDLVKKGQLTSAGLAEISRPLDRLAAMFPTKKP